MKGNENREAADVECPICFLNYAAINQTKCCQAHICTECFLQVRPQRDKSAACPFCNAPRVQVVVAEELDEKAIVERDQEEQRVIEAEIRSRARVATDGSVEPSGTAETSSSSTATTPEKSFGSSLEQHTRFLRARSGSVASEGSGCPSSFTDVGDIAALAMTPEERSMLEEEMRRQHSHPLAQRLQAEEDERRLQNDLNYYQAQSLRLHELRARRATLARTLAGTEPSSGLTSSGSGAAGRTGPATGRSSRDWNRIVEAFETSGGNRQVQSLDDLVVLEAAILLSMEEEARQRDQSASNAPDEQAQPFDAAQHASQGFPLARSRVMAGVAAARSDTASRSSRQDEFTNQVQSLMRTLQASPRSDRRDRHRSRLHRLGNDTTLSTASMLLRGITEEEQLAMAIAASLAESSRPAEGTGNDDAGAADDRSSEDADHADDDDDEEIITFETESEEQDDQAPPRSTDASQRLESTEAGPDEADSPNNSTGLGTDPDAPAGEHAHSADAVGDSQESTDDAPSRG
jgi:hypothetical protein